MIIAKVWKRKDGGKFITIPRKSDINEGDYVSISKVESV